MIRILDNKKSLINRFKFVSIIFILLIAIITPSISLAIDFPKPTEYKYVNDYAKVFNEETRDKIISIGNELEEKTSAQLTVVTVDTLDGVPIEDYANKLFRQWGIGSKDKDNGLLILVAIKDRKYRVEVGRGLEGAVPDILSNKIMENVAKPYFKEGNYSKGILDAYSVFADTVAEEYNVTLEKNLKINFKNSTKKENDLPPITIIGIVVAFIAFDLIFNKGKILNGLSMMFNGSGRKGYGGGVYIPHKHHHDDDDDFFGGFGGGGSSGGGFGGFGGGTSNGGGSSGSW